MEKRSIVIVGSGPAGVSTALSIAKLAPQLACETLILEKCHHPRHKLCGGGLTEYADMILACLGITSRASGFPIHQVKLYFSDKPVFINKPNLLKIIQRSEFDADLVCQAREHGIEIREGESLLDIRRNGASFELKTEKQSYLATVVVAADGAKSQIRRRLFKQNLSRISRLIEALIQVQENDTPDFAEHTATLDFRPRNAGLQGYTWDFPGFISGQAHLNIGVFDSRIHNGERAQLPAILKRHISARGLNPEASTIMAHPERWFHEKDLCAVPNLLLAGDAAGVEPWLGEGISMSLAYGPVAATAIRQAFENGDFSFQNYHQLIAQDKLGILLKRNRRIAWYFYRRRSPVLTQALVKLGKIYLNRKYGLAGMSVH